MKRFLSWYVISSALFLAVLAKVISVGGQLQGAATNGGHPRASNAPDALSQVLLQIVVIVVVAQIAGAIFRRFGQPSVIGEMMAGIALGPSLLGTIAPDVSKYLFSPTSLPHLSTLSQVGIILFMFGVGMELDMVEVKANAKSALLVCYMSIIVPFGLGALSSVWLYRQYHGELTNFLAFAAFIGISMSITAFPVLARILKEKKLIDSKLGLITLTAAAIGDASAWCVLAMIVALARAQSALTGLWTVALTAAFTGIAFLVVRPILDRAFRAQKTDDDEPGQQFMVFALVCAFAFAYATQLIGIHAFFGAFVAGLILPQNATLRGILTDRLHAISAVVLLPVFFAFTGLRTQIGLMSGTTDWAVCAAVFLLAVLGKFGGGMLAAKVSGLSVRDSVGVGVLMNTRGLVELIALNIGLDLGVLSPKVFTMLVLMALATTFMTGPILSLLKLSKESKQGALAA